jgi:hypothetical protein
MVKVDLKGIAKVTAKDGEPGSPEFMSSYQLR